MVVDGEDLCFLVKVWDWGPLGATCCYTESRVLNPLELLDIGGGSVGEPDGSGIVENGADYQFVSGHQGLDLLAQGGPTQSF